MGSESLSTSCLSLRAERHLLFLLFLALSVAWPALGVSAEQPVEDWGWGVRCRFPSGRTTGAREEGEGGPTTRPTEPTEHWVVRNDYS